ncbi:hypothetical protein ABC974_01745 [Sphingomonas oligophenolica]|uniref:FAD-binding protein n=1 Tax=Sphingomonas oligophenolica TaxID=301154 RepID=A0ABU9XXR0_9SPHN
MAGADVIVVGAGAAGIAAAEAAIGTIAAGRTTQSRFTGAPPVPKSNA